MLIDPSTPFGAKVLHKLDTEQVIWLVTVGASGTPYPSPVWFLSEDNKCLLIYSRADAPKLTNIAERPNVALHFNTDFGGHEVVTMSGTATIVSEPTPSDQIPEYQTKYAKGIAGLNMTPAQFAAAYTAAIRVTITRVRGY
jgi:PPOX class probable F420-dependent enzyme